MTHNAALFGVELCAVKIVFCNRRRELHRIVARSRRAVEYRHHITMHEIHETIFIHAVIQRRPQPKNLVPTHLRDFFAVFRDEFHHIDVKNSQCVGVLLLGVSAHQLHPKADAKHRLTERRYQSVEVFSPQRLHRRARIAHTGKNHLVGGCYYVVAFGQNGLTPKPLQSRLHTLDVAGLVVNNRDFHFW